ncbi:hypothetical protein BaRGS_00019873 [Batillaria attramentaria]|uniref:Uncharacterized protein n=1 Tax=Batillaria attramentaria TaxID=370345 RepID=A0ABD0KPQ9_9CAEN
MTARDFRGFSSLQEVECSGANLSSEVKLLSLRIFQNSEDSVLAFMNLWTNECTTHVNYSSCKIDSSDTRKSRLRILVSDLEEGESRSYGCKASIFHSAGDTSSMTWTLNVKRNRLFFPLVLLISLSDMHGRVFWESTHEDHRACPRECSQYVIAEFRGGKFCSRISSRNTENETEYMQSVRHDGGCVEELIADAASDISTFPVCRCC